MALFGLMTQKETESAITAAVDAALKAQADKYPYWMLATGEAQEYSTDYMSAYEAQAELYRKLSWVVTACDITAQTVALYDFDVLRVIQEREPKDIPNHDFEMLLARPNDMDSRSEFIEATTLFYKLNGNSYWWMNKESEFAPPEELWFIPPHMVKPVVDGNAPVVGYMYYPGNGDEIFLDKWEVVHFRRPNPFNRFLGLSAMESLAMIARGDLSMQQYNTSLFSGNNGISGILAFSEMVSDPTWEKIKRDKNEAARKREMMMLRGVGQGGVEWMQNAISQRDMEFLAGRKSNRDEIWNVLAPGLVSMLSENSTEANSRTGKAVFMELTVYPVHNKIGEKVTNDILPLYGSSRARPLIGRFEDCRVTDRTMELEEIKTYSETHTIDEIRQEKYGDDPIGDERGDLLIVQINATSGGIQEPELPKTSPTGAPAGAPSAENKQEAAEDKTEEPKQTRAQKAVLELDAWQRKAVKDVGKRVKFTPEFVTEEVSAYVNTFLPNCSSKSAVKSVFDNARRMVDPDMTPKAEPEPRRESELIILARSLDAFAAKMQAPQGLTLDAIKALFEGRQPNIDITPIINVPENRTTIHLPEQGAPVSNVYLSPTVEAAKAPDVRVDAPVTVHNAAADAPVVNIQNTTNVPEQAAPIVNIENKAPDINLPETTLKAELIMPEQGAPVVNVNVQPTPIENKNEITVQPPEVKVDVPKAKRERQKINRNPDTGLIDSTDTEIEY